MVNAPPDEDPWAEESAIEHLPSVRPSCLSTVKVEVFQTFALPEGIICAYSSHSLACRGKTPEICQIHGRQDVVDKEFDGEICQGARHRVRFEGSELR